MAMKFYSLCSAHKEPDPKCPRCNIGVWEEKVLSAPGAEERVAEIQVELEGVRQAAQMRQAHIWRRQSTTTKPIPGTDPDDGFYVEDEPLADLLAAWDARADEVHLTEEPDADAGA